MAVAETPGFGISLVFFFFFCFCVFVYVLFGFWEIPTEEMNTWNFMEGLGVKCIPLMCDVLSILANTGG